MPQCVFVAVCSMPVEYCEWDPQFKKCKVWFAENWKGVYPDVEEDGLLELMTRCVPSWPEQLTLQSRATLCSARTPGRRLHRSVCDLAAVTLLQERRWQEREQESTFNDLVT